MHPQVLKLDITGMPERWITAQQAAGHYATDDVVWTLGTEMTVLHGGISRTTGQQSVLTIHPIIAVRGASKADCFACVPSLDNRKLFRRDNYTCAYCGERYPTSGLTRDHIVPKARGGRNTWINCISSCFFCNQKKRDQTPEEAGMALLFVPYVPSRFESLILEGRRILADQKEFLAARLPDHSRVRLS